MNRRRWKKEDTSLTAQVCTNWGNVYEGSPKSGYYRDLINVESDGRWIDYQGPVQVQQNDSFLIPA